MYLENEDIISINVASFLASNNYNLIIIHQLAMYLDDEDIV